MKMSILLVALLLGACANQPAHVANPPAHKAAVVKKSAPIATAEPDKKKLTFKERWLSRFFRNRAQ